MKNSRYTLSFLLLFGITASVYADGMAFKKRLDLSSFIPLRENEQCAAIHHSEGIQKMVIAINVDLADSENALWLLPMPSPPEQMTVDICDSYPRFFGVDPKKDAKGVINFLMLAVRTTQIYPVIIEAMFLPTLSKAGLDGLVVVHGEFKKWGVHVEKITAESLQDLTEYLQESNINLSTEHLSSFERYFTGKYTFIVTRIESYQELLNNFPNIQEQKRPGFARWPCLYLEFPTDKAYYPLVPTSGYGNRLQIMGYVKPETDATLSKKLSVSHYKLRGSLKNAPAAFAEGLDKYNKRYTAVTVRTQAKNFTDDLWFVQTNPTGIKRAEWIAVSEGPFLIFVIFILIAGLSYLSAGLAALIVFHKWRGFAVLGLWNFLTLLGFYYGVRDHFNARAKKKDVPPAIYTSQRSRFLKIFTLVFVGITIVLQILFHLLLV